MIRGLHPRLMAVFWSWLWGFQLHRILRHRHLLHRHLLHCRSCRPTVVQSVLLVVVLLFQHHRHPRHQESVVSLRDRHRLQPHIRRFLRLRFQLRLLLYDSAVGQLLPRLPLRCHLFAEDDNLVILAILAVFILFLKKFQFGRRRSNGL